MSAWRRLNCCWTRWWAGLYSTGEVDVSRGHLRDIFLSAEGEPVLLGGWAVYLVTSRSFKEATGREYIGSRDIDVGFHVEEGWSREGLEASPFGLFLRRMAGLGFQPQSFRLYKDFEYGSLRELTREEAAAKPAFEVVKLYVDPVVDRCHHLSEELFGFIPVDEPILSLAFERGLFEGRVIDGVEVKVAAPHLLLATKMNSVLTRQRDDKRLKDLSDIYALMWHSDVPFRELQRSFFEIYPSEKANRIASQITGSEVDQVSAFLGVEGRDIRRVLRAFLSVQ